MELTSKTSPHDCRPIEWRRLLCRLREKLWHPNDAPSLLLGIDPELSNGDEKSAEGWHIIWLTGRPVGPYSAYDSYSLEKNLSYDLAALHSVCRVSLPHSLSPRGWIKWASDKGLSVPWLVPEMDPNLSKWLRSGATGPRPRRSGSYANRFVEAGRARHQKTRFPALKDEVYKLWEVQNLAAYGRKAEFDQAMADRFGLEIRTVATWRREWQEKSQSATLE